MTPLSAVRRRRAKNLFSMTGFTLIEVLVAMTILAIGIALGVSVISKSMGNIRRVEARARLVEHANSVMELTLLDPEIRGPGAFNGDFADGTRWTMRIEEYVPEYAPDESILSEVDIPVILLAYTVEMFPPRSNVVNYRLRTLKLVPRQ